MCALGGWDSHWEFPNLGMSILMPSLILMSYSVSLSWFLIVNYTKKMFLDLKKVWEYSKVSAKRFKISDKLLNNVLHIWVRAIFTKI